MHRAYAPASELSNAPSNATDGRTDGLTQMHGHPVGLLAFSDAHVRVQIFAVEEMSR